MTPLGAGPLGTTYLGGTFFAQTSAPNPLLGNFVGRDELLRELRDRFLGGSRVGLITGSEGVGKTALASQFAYTVAPELFLGGTEFLEVNWQMTSSPSEDEAAIEGDWLRAWIADSTRRWTDEPSEGLLIVDGFGILSNAVITKWMELARRRGPRILFIDRDEHGVVADFHLRVKPFTIAELNQILTKSLGRLDKPGLVELMRITGGIPAKVNLAIFRATEIGTEYLGSFGELLSDFAFPGLVDSEGHPLSQDAERLIISSVCDANDELLQKLAAKPDLLYELSDRKFEQIVAEIMSRFGYDVTLTPSTRDGGKDIYAAKKNDLGSFLYVVECKKYAPNRPVGVGVLRQLYGVVEQERATAGLVVTTSSFTQPAQSFTSEAAFRLSLKDYTDLHSWLNKVTNVRSS